MIITAGQIIWTSECEKALADPDEARAALKALKRKWVATKLGWLPLLPQLLQLWCSCHCRQKLQGETGQVQLGYANGTNHCFIYPGAGPAEAQS
jgi:hypothetical protein